MFIILQNQYLITHIYTFFFFAIILYYISDSSSMIFFPRNFCNKRQYIVVVNSMASRAELFLLFTLLFIFALSIGKLRQRVTQQHAKGHI